MSIIIPGVELPPIDEYLHLRIDGNGYVSMQISENQYICDLYDTDKKAIELPPHGRLGDLDKLDYAFTALRFNGDGSLNHWDDRKNWCLHGSEIEMLLANAPTILPADPEGGGSGNV